ncbi:uncharacterized protein LOC123293818 [Chrysoperla carnea]|uniref:uncharacterized protein LOC123293818 n=1 Tax=Chrysoperla carnea TaxID=189513 RepID=UPI001D06866B|nr:uncharacterized protein LOC123293818 [Chrysoperla carnea]
MVHSSNKLLLLNCILFVCLLWKPIYGQFDNTEARPYNALHSVNDVSENTNPKHVEQQSNKNTHVENPQQSSFPKANYANDHMLEFTKLTGINIYGLSQKFNVFWMKFGPILKAASCFLGKVFVASARMIIYSNFLSSILYRLGSQLTCFVSGTIGSFMETIIERVEYLTDCKNGCGNVINMYTLMQKIKILIKKFAPIVQKFFEFALKTITDILKGLFSNNFDGTHISCGLKTACGCANNINNIPLRSVNLKEIFGGKINKK